MRSSCKRRGVLGQWTTIIVIVLLLAFLVSVAPVGGAISKKQCFTKCGPTKKTITTSTPEHQELFIKTYRIRGVTYEKYRIMDRTCYSGYYYRICEPRTWCTNTNACAAGTKYEEKGAPYQKCSGWRSRYELRRV